MITMLFIVACKKAESVKPDSDYLATFTFSPNNVPSAITFKNFQTGEIKTHTNQTEELNFDYPVKPGDRYLMEMKGITSGLNNSYIIKMVWKNKVIESDRALGGPANSEQILKIDKTFHELDFKN